MNNSWKEQHDLGPLKESYRRENEKKTACKHGHKLEEPNLASDNRSHRVCKACTIAFQWAKRNHKFYDDPLVIARAHANYKRYMGEISEDECKPSGEAV